MCHHLDIDDPVFLQPCCGFLNFCFGLLSITQPMVPSSKMWKASRSRLGNRHGSICVDGKYYSVTSLLVQEEREQCHYFPFFGVVLSNWHTSFGLFKYQASLAEKTLMKQWWIEGVVRRCRTVFFLPHDGVIDGPLFC